MRSQFDSRILQGLLGEIWDSLSQGLDPSLRYVPVWRYELEWRLHLVVTCPSIQMSYLQTLAGFQASRPTGVKISLEELPVKEMIEFGLSRPVLTDGQIARLALSGETLCAFCEAWLNAANEHVGDLWYRACSVTAPAHAREPAPDRLFATLRNILNEEGQQIENDLSNCQISDFESEQILQAFALRKDRELVPLQHTRFFAQVRKQAHILESIYREMDECPTALSTIEFTTLYVRFHSILATVGPHQSVVVQACEFIRTHESQHPLTENRKAQVLAEHRQLLDAIQTGDAFGASDAMICHLTNSEQRWLPEFHDSLSERNASFFQEMQEDSFLCVSTINVLPIECEEAEWPTLGMAVADALARGAALLYICPAPEITQKLLGASGESTPWQNELKVDFEDFIEMVSGHIRSVSPRRFVSHDEALAYVRSRVHLLSLNDDAIFVRTQPDRTCGYFWFKHGSELLTERKPLLNDVTHRKIERIDDPHNFENFKDYLTEALTMARSQLQADQESLQRRLDHVLSCLDAARHHELETATSNE